jgi:peroxiredoxin
MSFVDALVFQDRWRPKAASLFSRGNGTFVVHMGLSGRDAGVVLGISQQRFSQLVADH